MTDSGELTESRWQRKSYADNLSIEGHKEEIFTFVFNISGLRFKNVKKKYQSPSSNLVTLNKMSLELFHSEITQETTTIGVIVTPVNTYVYVIVR